MDLLDLLQGQVSGGLVEQLSKQVGAKPEQTKEATTNILSTLMAAISKNASTPEGAASLTNALERDHDGSIFDNLSGFLGGQAQAKNSSMLNGAGILKHVLGGKQAGAIDMISKMSGLNGGQTGNLMATLAPMVLGMLGKQKKAQGLDAGGIGSLLSGAMNAASGRKEMGLVGRLLDADGDGSFMDDIAEKGLGMLGKFLKR